MTTIHLLDNIERDDMENAFFTKFIFKWATYCHNGNTVNYGVPPDSEIEIVLPKKNMKITLNLIEVKCNNTNLFSDEINIEVEEYVSYYQVYLNPKNSSSSNFIECKGIDVKIESYELSEELILELFLNDNL